MGDRIACLIARTVFGLSDFLDRRLYNPLKPYLDKMDAKMSTFGRLLYGKAQKGGAA